MICIVTLNVRFLIIFLIIAVQTDPMLKFLLSDQSLFKSYMFGKTLKPSIQQIGKILMNCSINFLKFGLFGKFYNFFSNLKIQSKTIQMIQIKEMFKSYNFSEPRLDFSLRESQQMNQRMNQTLRIEQHLMNIDNFRNVQQLFIAKQLGLRLERNDYFIHLLSGKLDTLDNIFEELTSNLRQVEDSVIQCEVKTQKQTVQNEEQDSKAIKKIGRIHYKALFRQKIFGMKDYKYRLNVLGKIPTVLFKQRNINLKITLQSLNGQRIENQNAISLNLKAFFSDGKQIGETKKGENFIKGNVNSTMLNGIAAFDKLYPRQVSRKMDRRKIVLVIYASTMGNSLDQNTRIIDPEQIQPIILYGVKIITKQTKLNSQKRSQIGFSEQQSQFVA